MTTLNGLPLSRRTGSGISRFGRPTTAMNVQSRLQAMPRRTVTQILAEWGPWVCCMGLMGMCEDGIPLAARFFDPKKSSHYVYYGQDDMVLATLVEPLLYSMTVQGYGPEHWQYAIVSERTTEWAIEGTPWNKSGIISPYENSGREVVPAMAGLMEQRSFGRHKGPQYIVLLHDLGRYWENLGNDTHYDIIPLLERGHEFGIHLIVTLRYTDNDRIPKAVRRLLGHKIYGYADSDHLPNVSAFRNMTNLLYYDLQPWQAWVQADGEWLRFTAPRLG